MDFSLSTLWWVLTGLVIAAELATGTLYLLMIALGMAAAGLCALFGFAVGPQLVVFALVGGGATALWHWHRSRHPRSLPAARNRDVNLDIGERVNVTAWDTDRTARVHYRGTLWTARLDAATPAAAGPHTVQAVEGNWLVLAPVAPHPAPHP